MKQYSNSIRKPMMYGGMSPRKKMAHGGSHLTPEQRKKLEARKKKLQAAIKKGGRPQEILDQMSMDIMQIDDQLGLNPTPGRSNIDGGSAD